VRHVPGGETITQELGLGHGARETLYAPVMTRLWRREAIESHGSARGGQAARQLDGGGYRGGEEDERAKAHRFGQC
jgi:hypothetical protein